ncbi:hypothetical protein ACHQM5_015115 [Ranunculus cassubicifolius]
MDNMAQKSNKPRFRGNKRMEEIAAEIGISSVSASGGDSEKTTLASHLEKRPSQIAARLKRVSQTLKWFHSSSKKFGSRVDRDNSGATKAFKGVHVMSKTVCSEAWNKIAARFDRLAVDGLLLKEGFAECIGMEKTAEFACHLFDVLVRRSGLKSSSITKEELHEFWKQLTDQSFDARLQNFFDLVDENADGRINEEEIKQIMTLSASANKLSKIRDRVDEYAKLIMEELDPHHVGYIELYSLKMLLLEEPTQNTTNLEKDKHTLNRSLSVKLVATKEPNLIKKWCKKIKQQRQNITYFIEDNWKQIWVMTLWFSICIGLFMWKFIQYKHRDAFSVLGHCLTTAKGTAETLNFNMALILLPVCRNTITWLRSRTMLKTVIPFDDNIEFHKVISLGITIGAGLHAGAHLTCNLPRLLHATDEQYKPFELIFGEGRPSSYWWFLQTKVGLTGVLMVTIMAIVFTLAQKLKLPKPLEMLGGFNAFWYSHHLFVIVYVLLIVHCREWHKKTTWMYLTLPITLYACERLIRAFRSNYKPVDILKAAVYPGNVVELQMSKPEKFNYRSGQYIFVKCPSISPFEWHPFSITSGPGDKYLSIHIRAVGVWTKQLKSLFSKVCKPASADQKDILIADMMRGDKISGLPNISIDGPYGAPAQDYRDYKVLLLVGLGIGVTPLISIVKDVLNKIKQQNDLKGKKAQSGTNNSRNKPSVATRVYFYWVTRDEGSYEWFKDVFRDVTQNDKDEVIDLHNYCSSVYEEGDARSALIAMVQSLQRAKSGVDVVSGTNVQTHFARPNWHSVFQDIANKHPNEQVGVFYCGAPALIRELKQSSRDFSRNTTTTFDFHKENF